MPWKIIKQNNKFCVVKKTDNKVLKCYSSESDAKKYLSALYANVEDSMREAAGLKRKKK